MPSRKRLAYNQGATFLELILVIALLAILFSFGYAVSIDFYNGRALLSERDTLVSLLRRTRTYALANYNEALHGMYIGPDAYTLFQGASYAARNTVWDYVVPKSTAVIVTGLQEIIFQPLDAGVATTGTIVMSHNGSSLAVEINEEGSISW